ncbi:hypothetical protein GOV11_03860 [Candidatus Woesearchaeota archaeon]|nr:hypothetical protein [Candidatus Woesearchaeota archaeon]
MKDDDGFFYEDPEGLSDKDELVLQGLKSSAKVDPVTGRKQKQINILNKKKLSGREMDEFFTDI